MLLKKLKLPFTRKSLKFSLMKNCKYIRNFNLNKIWFLSYSQLKIKQKRISLYLADKSNKSSIVLRVSRYVCTWTWVRLCACVCISCLPEWWRIEIINHFSLFLKKTVFLMKDRMRTGLLIPHDYYHLSSLFPL